MGNNVAMTMPPNDGNYGVGPTEGHPTPPIDPSPSRQPYTGGQDGLQRRWRQHRAPKPPKLPRVLAFLTLLTVIGLVAVRIASSPAGLEGAWNSLYETIVAVPQDNYESDTTPLARAPDVDSPNDSYGFMHLTRDDSGGEVPVRWSSCEVIPYVVNPQHGDEQFEDYVQKAVDEIAELTGLTFKYEGLSDEPPKIDRGTRVEQYGDRTAPVIIQFADEDAIPDLEGDIAGLANVARVELPGSKDPVYVSGAVYLDRELLDMRGRDGEPGYLPVLRHELGHLVGLDHIDDTDQLMFPAPRVTTYQDGDRTGLAQLGEGPCFSH